jgi:hypothetical protein
MIKYYLNYFQSLAIAFETAESVFKSILAILHVHFVSKWFTEILWTSLSKHLCEYLNLSAAHIRPKDVSVGKKENQWGPIKIIWRYS